MECMTEYWQNMAESLRRENQRLTNQVKVFEKALKTNLFGLAYCEGCESWWDDNNPEECIKCQQDWYNCVIADAEKEIEKE